MIRTQDLPSTIRSGSRVSRRGRRIASWASLLLIGAALFAGLALANQTSTLRASSNAKLNKTIVVDPHGRTLYALSPETAHHLLCKSRECFESWPPVTVRSKHVTLVAGEGLVGRLALLRRRNGTLQVTLRGMPLYRFAGDGPGGDAIGEGITSFGGRWHTVLADPGQMTTPSMTPPAPTSPSPPVSPPGYGY